MGFWGAAPVIENRITELDRIAWSRQLVGEGLSEFDIVFRDGSYWKKADSSNLAKARPPFGIMKDTALSGLVGDIILNGLVSNGSWSLASGARVFLASGGGATPTPSFISGNSPIVLGYAVGAKAVKFSPEPPIQLGYPADPTLFEYYNTGDDGNRGFYQTLQRMAQTFTPSVAHNISSVKVKLLRGTADAAPGTVTISIRATDGDGKPTGPDLCSGTTDGDTVTSTSPGEWREVTLGAGTSLLANTKYAIIAKCQTDDPTKPIFWRRDASAPSYTGGSSFYTADQGVTWTALAEDSMFEDWGIQILWPGL